MFEPPHWAERNILRASVWALHADKIRSALRFIAKSDDGNGWMRNSSSMT